MRRLLTIGLLIALSLDLRALAQDASPPLPPAPRGSDTVDPPIEGDPLPDPTVPGPLLRAWSGAQPALPAIELRALLVPASGAPAIAILEVDGVRRRVRVGTRLSATVEADGPGAGGTARSALVLVLQVTGIDQDGVVIAIEPLGVTLRVS